MTCWMERRQTRRACWLRPCAMEVQRVWPRRPKKPASRLTFTLVTTVADFPVPQIVRDAGGQYLVGQASQLIEVPVANIELDDNVVGLKNGALQAAAGLHKLRLQHELFKDWEGTVFISDGGRLSLAMQLDESGRARFKDVMDFYAGLKQGQVLERCDAAGTAWQGEGAGAERAEGECHRPAVTLDHE